MFACVVLCFVYQSGCVPLERDTAGTSLKTLMYLKINKYCPWFLVPWINWCTRYDTYMHITLPLIILKLICCEHLIYRAEMAESRPLGGATARRGVGRTTEGENHVNTRKCYTYHLRRVPASLFIGLYTNALFQTSITTHRIRSKNVG